MTRGFHIYLGYSYPFGSLNCYECGRLRLATTYRRTATLRLLLDVALPTAFVKEQRPVTFVTPGQP